MKGSSLLIGDLHYKVRVWGYYSTNAKTTQRSFHWKYSYI